MNKLIISLLLACFCTGFGVVLAQKKVEEADVYGPVKMLILEKQSFVGEKKTTRTVTYDFSRDGNLKTKVETVNGAQVFLVTYDSRERVITMVGRDGKITQQSYDEKSRVFQVVKDGQVVGNGTLNEKGQTSTYEDNDGSLNVESSYDSRGNLIEQKMFSRNYKVETIFYYSYDSKGRKNGEKSVAVNRDNPSEIINTRAYEFDSRGFLTQVNLPEGGKITYSYEEIDSHGNWIKRTSVSMKGARNVESRIITYYE